MATEEDVIRLMFEAQGIDTVEKARAEIANLDGQVNHLGDQLKQGAINAQQFANATQPLINRTADLQRGFGIASVGAGNLGRGFLEMSRGIEDMQYGIVNAANNLPMMVSMFGGPAGLAAGLSLAATGATILYRHWDDLMGLMDLDTVGSEAEQMERLEKSTGRTADETERLNRYKKEQKQIERMSGDEPKEQAKARKTAEEAITEAGGIDKLAAGLVATRNAGGLEGRMSGELRQRLEEIRAARGPEHVGFGRAKVMATLAGQSVEEYFDAQVKEVMEQARAEEFAIAQKDVAAAANDPNRLKGLITEIGRKPGAFPADAAKKLTEATPEAQEHEAEVDSDLQSFELHIEEVKRLGRENEQTRRKNRREITDLLKPTLDQAIRAVALGGGPITPEEAAAEMRRLKQGLDPAKAARFGKQGADIVNKLVEEAIRGRMGEKGIDRAAALAQLVDDMDEKDRREAESKPEARRAKQRQQAALRTHQAGIKEDMRDLGRLAKMGAHDRILAEMLMEGNAGVGEEQANENIIEGIPGRFAGLAAEINAHRMSQGLAPDMNYARGIASQVVDDMRGGLNEELAQAIDKNSGFLGRLENALNAGLRKGAKINLGR